MKIIAFANQKGGVGKTTTAVTLAHGLALNGVHTLLVDLDPQGHVAFSLGLEKSPDLYRLICLEEPISKVTRKARENLDILAGEEVNVVVCPSTHMKYGMGVARLPEMLNLGVNVALGTDGAGSSTALNLWHELRLAVLSQRQAQGDATLLAGATPLHLAGPNGARALGFERAGVLAPGYAADLIVVDTTAAHFQPLHDVVANLVWCTQPADVCDVMVAGRWLMRQRRLLTIDEAQVLAGFQAAVAGMLAAPLAQFRRYDL